MINLFDFIIHIDKYVDLLIKSYGNFVYFILFLIIFLETGLVMVPFLPGDSLLFIVGAFAAKNSLNLPLVIILLSIAAIAGDTVNYFLGNYFGKKVFSKSRFFRPEYLEKTKEFYKKHGKKTIILARFVPIIRTFAPFVAGIGKMDYRQFVFYNIMGGILWVALFTLGGYFFGGIPIVEKNLTFVIFLIIILSFIPVLREYLKHRIKKTT